MTDSGDCADTGKRPGKVLIKKQMSLGNGPIFILVKLDNSNDIINFLILPAYLFFYKTNKGAFSSSHNQIKKIGFCFVNLRRYICSKDK